MVTSFLLFYFYLGLFFPCLLQSLFCSIFVPRLAVFLQFGALFWKAALLGGLILRIYMTHSAPAFSRTYLALTCYCIGYNLSIFSFYSQSGHHTASKYLVTILMFSSSPSNALLPPYLSCTEADFMQVLWLLMVFPTHILRFMQIPCHLLLL